MATKRAKRPRKSWKLYEALHAENTRLEKELKAARRQRKDREREDVAMRHAEQKDMRFVEELYVCVTSEAHQYSMAEVKQQLEEHLLATSGLWRANQMRAEFDRKARGYGLHLAQRSGTEA
jgi:hypothetical protein